MRMENMMTVLGMGRFSFSSVWLLFVSTCCMAWPTAYRRSYQYFPPMMAAELGPPNQWDIAQEPLAYEQPEDYYDTPQWADMEALSNLIDMYDNSPPVWGQIVNEQPEDELHELKRSQASPVTQTQTQNGAKVNVGGQRQRQNVPQSKSSGITLTNPTTATLVQSVTDQPQILKESQPMFHRGQKEFPLLRPPVKPKANPSQEPNIISAQLNSAERHKKPSPYDTLRKYLSLEDALKKEADKRRADGRHQKRSSNFVTEVASLTGQLNNLKKTMT